MTAGVRVAGVTVAEVGEGLRLVAMDTGPFAGLPNGVRTVNAARGEVVGAVACSWRRERWERGGGWRISQV